MFIVSFKVNKHKIFMIVLILVIIFVLLGFGYKAIKLKNIKVINQTNLAAGEPEKTDVVKFIESYGWKPDVSSVEIEEFALPEVFDTIYKKYNQYQKDVGLDISPYKGKLVKRYTFKINNYKNPEKYKNQQVYADVLVYNKKIIAGDLKTNELNGFMVSLKNRAFKEITGIEEWMFK